MRAIRVLIPLLVLLSACSPSSDSQAQPKLAEPVRAVPTSALSMKQSFAPVVKKVAPAVVNISSKRLVRTQVDPFFQLFGLGAPRDRIEGSLGSGVIVRSDGVIITNNHVVAGGQEITVALADRREFPAHVLLADPRTDLAVLKIDVPGERLPVLAIDDQGDNQVGDLVLAIGDPFGVGQTVTNGIISALNRTADPNGDSSAYIQTDAAINPGNSGGALVNMAGDLIGVNSFILSQSGTSSGVGFAIPAPVVRRFVEAALGGGHAFVRPWLGARLQSVSPDVAKALGLARPSGALVADVWPGGSAARAGLRQGDVITAVDGQPVVDAAGVNYVIGNHRSGDTVALGVRRGAGAVQTVSVHAEPAPATPARDERVIAGRNPFQGATVVNLSPAVAEELGIDPFGSRGVLVTKTGPGFAQRVFQPGDIIRAVNGREIRTVGDLAAAVAASGGGWRVTLERNGQRLDATFA